MATTAMGSGRSLSLPGNSLGTQSLRRHSALQSFGFRRKSEIEIVLDGNDDFIHSYSTFDEIKGYVKLQFEKDTSIDDVHVYFLGQTDTWVERMAGAAPRSGRALAKHIFLRMQQPIPGNIFLNNRVAKAGIIYTIPFTFVIPDRLLPFVCCHKSTNVDVKNQHLQLPPSTGDETIAGEGSVLMNDLAPAMSKIVYSVRVRIAKAALTSRNADVLTESLRVRVIPAREEMPPVSVEDGPRECMKFRLRKEKDVRKGLFRIGKKLGRLTAETSQPKPIQLPRPNQASQEPPSTLMNVQLRYDPAFANEQPPQLSSIVTKLKTLTFFGATAFQNLPCANQYDVYSAFHGHYPNSMELSTMKLSSVTWTRHGQGKGSGSASVDTEPQVDAAPVSTAKKASSRLAIRRPSIGTAQASNDSTPAYREEEGAQHRIPLARRESAFSDTSELSTTSSGRDSNRSSSTLSSSTTRPQSVTSLTMPEPTISPSISYNSDLPYYTTSIVVPISLPITQSASSVSAPATCEGPPNTRSRSKCTTFLPTFHSCLVSRTYSLDLNVSALGTNVPSINLHVPLQMYLKLAQQNPHQQHNNIQQYRQTSDNGHLTNEPGTSTPPSFHNPFAPDSTESTNANQSSIGGYLDDDLMFGRNDEAIARVLGRSASYSNYPYAPTSTYPGRIQPNSLPEEDEEEGEERPYNESEKTPTYTEIDTQRPHTRSPLSAPTSPYSETAPPRTTVSNTSEYNPTIFDHQVMASPGSISTTNNNNNDSDQQPPSYYSSFRHTSALASELATTSSTAARSSSTTTTSAAATSQSQSQSSDPTRQIRRASTQNTTASGIINTASIDEPRPRTIRRDSAASRLRIRRWI